MNSKPIKSKQKGRSMNGNSDKPNYAARARTRRAAEAEAEFGLGYLLATIENHINAYGDQTGYTYSVASTAYRLGRLLTAKALRVEPGLAQLLPEVQQGNPTALLGAGHQFPGHDQPEQAEVHVHARTGRPLTTGKFSARELGRPLTPEEKRENQRIQAQIYRDRKAARRNGGVSPVGPWKGMTHEQISAELASRQQISAELASRFGKKSGRRIEVGAAFVQQRAQALAAKRVLTPKALRAMRKNAKLARAAHKAKYSKKKRTMSPETRARLSVSMKAAYARKAAQAAAQTA